METKFCRVVYNLFLLFSGTRCMLETGGQRCLRKEALKGIGMRVMRRIAAFLMAVFMLAGVCTAAEPQISAEGLAMMGVLDPKSDLAEPVEKVSAETETWKLLLVNPWNKIPEGSSVTLKKLANGLQVDERIYDDLNAMLTECWRLGMHPVVCSAYRPHATQVRLHNNKIARLRSARKLEYLNFELNIASKPGRHENDLYGKMTLEEYYAEAYKRACRIAFRYSK